MIEIEKYVDYLKSKKEVEIGNNKTVYVLREGDKVINTTNNYNNPPNHFFYPFKYNHFFHLKLSLRKILIIQRK